jgi:hypothetical protein
MIRPFEARSVNCGRIIFPMNNCLVFVLAPVDYVDNRPFCSSACMQTGGRAVDESQRSVGEPWMNQPSPTGCHSLMHRSPRDLHSSSPGCGVVVHRLSTGCGGKSGCVEAGRDRFVTGLEPQKIAKIVFAERFPGAGGALVGSRSGRCGTRNRVPADADFSAEPGLADVRLEAEPPNRGRPVSCP